MSITSRKITLASGSSEPIGWLRYFESGYTSAADFNISMPAVDDDNYGDTSEVAAAVFQPAFSNTSYWPIKISDDGDTFTAGDECYISYSNYAVPNFCRYGNNSDIIVSGDYSTGGNYRGVFLSRIPKDFSDFPSKCARIVADQNTTGRMGNGNFDPLLSTEGTNGILLSERRSFSDWRITYGYSVYNTNSTPAAYQQQDLHGGHDLNGVSYLYDTGTIVSPSNGDRYILTEGDSRTFLKKFTASTGLSGTDWLYEYSPAAGAGSNSYFYTYGYRVNALGATSDHAYVAGTWQSSTYTNRSPMILKINRSDGSIADYIQFRQTSGDVDTTWLWTDKQSGNSLYIGNSSNIGSYSRWHIIVVDSNFTELANFTIKHNSSLGAGFLDTEPKGYIYGDNIYISGMFTDNGYISNTQKKIPFILKLDYLNYTNGAYGPIQIEGNYLADQGTTYGGAVRSSPSFSTYYEEPFYKSNEVGGHSSAYQPTSTKIDL
jgi:hypothetical protein